MPVTNEINVFDVRYDHGIVLSNLPTRYYAPAHLHGDDLPAGVWTDHGNRQVQELIYELRNRQGDNRLSHEQIAAVLGLRHWRDSYNGARNHGRRMDGDNGRNAAGELTWRAWNRRNMRTAPTAPARPGARPDGSLVTRRFGIELEFNRGTYQGYDMRSDIVRDVVAAGISASVESYNHNTAAYWKMTTDATVTGGEFVSPPLAGDTASLDEVRDIMRIMRNHGAESTQSVGMHVHHDATDFVTSVDKVRLIDALEASEHAMSRFVLPARVNGGITCGADMMRQGEWAQVRHAITAISPGSQASISNYADTTVSRYRFYNVLTPFRKYGTVEFRGLGATLHAGKMRVWVRMGQAIIESARQGVTITVGCTPQELVDVLVAANLVGRQTGAKFVAECDRRAR
jgi:hypothetical protein